MDLSPETDSAETNENKESKEKIKDEAYSASRSVDGKKEPQAFGDTIIYDSFS
ncbi:Uncharacterised protein [uncultured archaeon]|nr:Uncharacterised protein [uncultured archaeon]